MILQIFVVKDRATDQFGNPMFLVAKGQAIRSFSDEVNRSAPDNQIFQHPDDFDLFELGSYDSNTGVFETHVPTLVVLGKSVKVRS
jgi:hypothetical protein